MEICSKYIYPQCVYNLVELAKSPICNQLSPSGCKLNSSTNAYFIAFIIGEHAVLENWFIHIHIYINTNKFYLLIFMVLCYSKVTCRYYVFVLTRMQIFHWKPDLLLVSIFVKSLIDVHQIARKKESVFKDLDIIQLTWIEMDN